LCPKTTEVKTGKRQKSKTETEYAATSPKHGLHDQGGKRDRMAGGDSPLLFFTYSWIHFVCHIHAHNASLNEVIPILACRKRNRVLNIATQIP